MHRHLKETAVASVPEKANLDFPLHPELAKAIVNFRRNDFRHALLTLRDDDEHGVAIVFVNAEVGNNTVDLLEHELDADKFFVIGVHFDQPFRPEGHLRIRLDWRSALSPEHAYIVPKFNGLRKGLFELFYIQNNDKKRPNVKDTHWGIGISSYN